MARFVFACLLIGSWCHAAIAAEIRSFCQRTALRCQSQISSGRKRQADYCR